MCENIASEHCEACGHAFCSNHRYRYDYLVMWGPIWEGTGYPPARWLCGGCCEAMQEARLYHQKLKENGGKTNEAGYSIVKEHLEKIAREMQIESIKILLKNEKCFNAKVDYFYNGVFGINPVYILYIREWILKIAQDILNCRKDTDKHASYQSDNC